MNRRDAMLTFASAAVAAKGSAFVSQALAEPAAGPFKLPALGYGYDALEPHIDTATMKVHHSGHHQAFVTKLNELATKAPVLGEKSAEAILSDLSAVPEDVRTPVRNNLGGHFNHTFFWDLMTPGGAKEPGGDLKSAIDGAFGGTDKLIDAVTKAGIDRFGSGWAWLAVDKDKKLKVFATPYQDTPHIEQAAKPVLGVDVWEHAYYLKHQNKRAAYLKDWWNVVNWDKAAENFKKATA